LPSDAEVVVIGGGVMGVAATYWLARFGVSALLVEARSVANGASGRNAGLLLPGGAPIEDPALVGSVVREESIDADLATPGHLALATTPEVWERMSAEATRTASSPRPILALDRPACEDLLGMRLAKRFLGGRWFARGGLVHPVRFTRGLAAAAQRRGALVASQTRVLDVADRVPGDRLRVRTDSGSVLARDVVFACGAWLRELVPAFREFVTPVRGQMLATSPLPPLFRVGLAIDWGTVYWRQASDGVVVLGGYRNLDPGVETGADEVINPRIQDSLTRFLPETFPDFPPFRVGQRWAGIMDCTTDGRPLIGALPGAPNRWVIAGFGGHGMPGALGAGRELAEALRSRQVPSVLDPYDPRRGARNDG
jgi:glycine/D-amino acid oxidase-like deaminating enzyme